MTDKKPESLVEYLLLSEKEKMALWRNMSKSFRKKSGTEKVPSLSGKPK